MKKLLLILLLLIGACWHSNIHSQTRAIDSLQVLLKNSKEDTGRVILLQELARKFNTELQTDKARTYVAQANALSVKLKYTRGQFVCCNVLALICQKDNDYPRALECYLKALKFAEQMSSKADIAITYDRMGSIHSQKGNYNECIEPFAKALSLYTETGNYSYSINVHLQLADVYRNQDNIAAAEKEYQKGIAIALSFKDTAELSALYESAGYFYNNLGKYDKALKYQKASLEASKSLGDIKGIADSYADIAEIYVAQKDYKKALESYLSALELYKQIEKPSTVAETFMRIGQVYMYLGQYVKAIDAHFSALKITEELDDHKALSGTVYLSLSDVYINSKEYDKAMEWINKTIRIAKDHKKEQILKTCYQKLSDLAIKKQDYKLAYEFQKLFAETTDSIYNSYSQEDKQVRALQQKFEEEKKANEKKLHDAQLAQKESELKQASTIRFALITGLVLIVGFSGFIYNRFKLTQRQKETISLQKEMVEIKRKETEEQKLVIEHKQKEIIESISYAKRLQEAILPPQEFVSKYVPDNFILYKPKDLVAGDFYWAEEINDLFFIAAADSTGHGVPGAMVSVVCSGALHRAVKEFKETESGKILDKTRELVLETFERSESDVKDGMDVSLLCIDKKQKRIHWSGANNPLWYIKHNELNEIKADKQPIGKSDHPKPFTSHEISYEKGYVFYLFTDGYADQFGGPKGKKFKYKQLADTFLHIHTESMNHQKSFLENTFESWKGDLEQVDDVCIIGIRL
ncbi:MAG TPA: tetratricopeptide repeat protein [Bacteroidia bacterium]